jgi:hypothetical protein
MQVQALWVSETDAQGSPFVLMPMADFTRLPYIINGAQHNRSPYLNMQVNESGNPFGEVAGLPKGIHLHWQLPAGLTRAQQQPDGSLLYPVVPNRWVVTRIHRTNPNTGGEYISSKSWVVESDRLNPTPVAVNGLHQPSVPVVPDNSSPSYRFIGQIFDASGWAENYTAERFGNLTAAGYGEASFASYYPNCCTVFGFQDSLSDTQYSSNDTFCYQVTGWYSDAQSDPLVNGIESGNNVFGWVFENSSGGAVTNTFCCGMIEMAASLFDSSTVVKQPSPLSMAVGNSSQEALSVMLANQLNTDVQLAEQVINALQFGVIAQAGSSNNLAVQLDKMIHAAGFASYDGGRIWQVRKRTSPGNNQNYEGEVTLPATIADDLNILNIRQTELNELHERLASKRAQLFSDWYKYLLIEYQTHYTPESVRQRGQEVCDFLLVQASEIMALGTQADASGALQQSINDMAALITSSIDEVYELVSDATAPRYWRPNNPYLLFNGNDVIPVNRTGDDTLRCRISTDLVYTLLLPAGAAGNQHELSINNTVSFTLSYTQSSMLRFIFDDSMLLAPALQSYYALQFCNMSWDMYNQTLHQSDVTAYLSDELTQFMAQEPGADANFDSNTGVTAIAPDTLQQTTWSGNPWMPLMLHYEVEMQPVQNLQTTGEYLRDFVLDNFSWSSNGLDLSADASPAGGNELFAGTMLLSADAQVDLWQGIQSYLTQTGNTDPDFAALLESIASMPLMAQELSGFNESLLMRQQSLQMRVDDPLANPFDMDFVQTIRNAVGNAGDYSPEVNHSFNPIRAGALRISRLRIVDAFGRFADNHAPEDMYFSATLTPPPSFNLPADTMLLPPRLSQPSRLLFRWLSADTGTMESNSHPATSPVLGWVLPDFADRSILIFSADGTPLGELALSASADSVLWFSAPGGRFPVGTSLQAVFENELLWLRNFANGMYRGSADNFAAFLLSLRTAALTAMPETSSGLNGVLASQPLALTRATLALDLLGDTVTAESWDAFAAALVPGTVRNNAGFDNVRFPVQLGAAGDYRDGLLGYWMEQNSAVDFEQFYAPGSGVLEPGESTLTLAPDNRTKTVMMLLDPNGVVNATTGILPVKEIRIPADQFEAALNQLSFTMLTAPILSGSSTSDIRIPMPKTTGGFWSWVSADADGNWQSQNFGDTIQNASQGTLDYTPQQILEGWLRLRRTND